MKRKHPLILRVPARPGGAVIIVVVSLMTTLVFLGLFFYNWTSQERANADYFSSTIPVEQDPDEIFDFGLKQVISHTDDSLQDSALFGSRWSMLSHVIGAMNGNGTPTDLMPYNGAGIAVRINPNLLDSNNDGISDWRQTTRDNDHDGHVDITSDTYGMSPAQPSFWFDFIGVGASTLYPSEDLDGNGNVDAYEDLNGDGNVSVMSPINLSMAANRTASNTINVFNVQATYNSSGTPYTFYPYRFSPDAGYTYPDINSLFLSYEDPVNGVVIPSYFRPQYLTVERGSEGGFGLLYTALKYRNKVLRPHQLHVNASSIAYGRFLSTGTQANSGDRNRIINAFQFNIDLDSDGNYNECGMLSVPPSNNSLITPGASGTLAFEFDADADGDGTRDAIYMDLDHPIIDLPNGQQVMPLYYFKIVDADGLINLNVHGNLNRVPNIADFTHRFGLNATTGQVESVSTSNLGLGPSEVNPVWALSSNPNSSATLGYNLDYALRDAGNIFNIPSVSNYYSTGASSNRERITITANMEWAMLLKGRTDYYGGPGFLGRWSTGGSGEGISFGAKAGMTGTDDDGDSQLGGRYHADTYLSGITQPPFVHPLDFTGQARYPDTAYNNNVTDMRRSLGGTPLAGGSPAQWATYDGNWQETDPTQSATVNGVMSLRASSVTGLQAGANSTGLLDEPNETIVGAGRHDATTDQVFHSSEMAALHLSNARWTSLGQSSRLRNLAPLNFEFSRQSEYIRDQFTTESWDRKESGYPLSYQRIWEIKDISTARFPPSFGSITSRHENISSSSNAAANINTSDPFRPVVRRLLSSPVRLPQQPGSSNYWQDTFGLTSFGGNSANIFSPTTNRNLPQQRLNINRLLVNFDVNGNPIYRELTPHPTFATGDTDSNNYLINSGATRPMQHSHLTYYDGNSTPITTNYYDSSMGLDHLDPSLPQNSPYALCPLSAVATDKFAQEAWARYDRQRLARDIYVLLTVVGSAATDGSMTIYPPTTNPLPATQAKEIAQFAVNYVDALDRDNVITRFDYDADLTDGWNNADQSVYGVEAQTLSFSEVCYIETQKESTDLTNTLHQDNDAVHQFLYIELRNSSPFDVDLSGLDASTGSAGWRIVRTNTNQQATTAEVEITGSPRVSPGPGNTGSIIGPGENFLISCHDGSVTMTGGAAIPSDFYVNFENGNELEPAFPDASTAAAIASNGTAPTLPLADLDLAWTSSSPYNHQKYFRFTKRINGGTTTTLIDPDPSVTTFDLVLQRRQNLNAFGKGETQWIEVDRISISNPKSFNPGTDDQAGMQAAVANIHSWERPQPLASTLPATTWWSSATTGNTQEHTLATSWNVSGTDYRVSASAPNQKNSVLSTASGKFDLWQPHFDREFSSVMELLAIPLYGPLGSAGSGTFNFTTDGSTAHHFANSGKAAGQYTAIVRFQNPQATYPGTPSGYYDTPNYLSPPAYQNTWYRLFHFITTGFSDNQYGEQLASLLRRDPGRLNINTIRQEAVYAGLIDDDAHLDPFGKLASGVAMTLDKHDPTPFSTENRQWYRQMQIARDGFDPVLTNLSPANRVPVPGLPGAAPFRGAAYVDPNSTEVNDTVQHTLLRELPGVREELNQRGFGLFDARTVSDYTSANYTVDYHTAKRLLAKVANLTTTRSHVFVIHAGYDLFEAHQPTSTTVQIGGKSNIPGRRMFLVVDMSRLEEAYNPNTGTFDFRKFIIHRQLLP